MTPDTKPRKRVKATRAEWAEIHRQFEHLCCQSCGERETELHHVTPRSQRGGDVAENLIPLCRWCHTKLETHGPGWERVAASVRRYVMARETRKRYALETLGADRFDARYPVPPWLALGDLQAGPSMFNREGVE